MNNETAESGREPDRIRAKVEALLAELPGEAELAELADHADLDEFAQRMEAAHDVLVRALESVEKG